MCVWEVGLLTLDNRFTHRPERGIGCPGAELQGVGRYHLNLGPLEDKVLITTEHSIQPHDFFLFEELEKNKFKIKK